MNKREEFMNFLRILSFCVVLSVAFNMAGLAQAGSWDNDPTGQPISDYKPSGPSPTIKEPPPPPRDPNPTNDPDVQAGWDKHQAEYGS
jgi:hypothetical protein